MVEKSSVSALQEYCAKKKLPFPVYEFSREESGFVCIVEVAGEMAQAHGRSKRDGKHLAAAIILQKLRRPTDVELIAQPVATHDMVGALRDYCILNGHPLPTFDLVQQAGTPDAPEFTIICKIASIKRYGISDKKKDARQKAAAEVLSVIINEQAETRISELGSKTKDVEVECFKKFKTYREFTESSTNEIPGTLLCNRHNHFTKYYEHIKKEAWNIIRDINNYNSSKAQALDLLRALKIEHKVTVLNSSHQLYHIDLLCDYDVAFAGSEDVVYRNVIQYFKDML